MYQCPRCNKNVSKLIALDDADTTATYSGLLNVPYPCTDYLCISCAMETLGITEQDLIQEERNRKVETEFLLNLLKGNLAQEIIHFIFLEFGYEVYSYGYESYLTNIVRHLRKGNANIPARKVRATPDLFIYDREMNEGFFLEVKATNTPDEEQFWISKPIFQTYLDFWQESILIVYCILSMNIYCCQVKDIDVDKLPIVNSTITSGEKYVLNLKADFCTLPQYFRLIKRDKYEDFIQRIRSILNQFSHSA